MSKSFPKQEKNISQDVNNMLKITQSTVSNTPAVKINKLKLPYT